MKFRIICLILIVSSVGCSTSHHPLPSATESSVRGLQSRVKGLEDRGAAEVMPGERYKTVKLATNAVVDSASLAYAVNTLGEFEAAFDEIAMREASSAREACIRLQWEVKEVEETIAGGPDCEGLPGSVAALIDRLDEARFLAFTMERNVRLARQVHDLVNDARRVLDDVIVSAAVCGIVGIGPDNADQMVEAAAELARSRRAYGSAARLYANVIEGASGTEAGAAAKRRIDIFGPELQRRLAATVRSAAAACDAEVAHTNLDRLDGLVAALSETGHGLIDPMVGWSMPELEQGRPTCRTAVRASLDRPGGPRDRGPDRRRTARRRKSTDRRSQQRRGEGSS